MWAFIKTHVLASFGTVIGASLAVGGLMNDAWSIVTLGLPSQAWAALGALIFFISVIAVLAKQHKSLALATPKVNVEVESASSATQTNAISEQISPTPIFGCPCQGAREPYLSWWHIPVSVAPLDGQISKCRVSIIPDSGAAIRMRWQSRDLPQGSYEIDLVGGRQHMVPIAIRCEEGADTANHTHGVLADGIARITSDSFLNEKTLESLKQNAVTAGRHYYRIRIEAPNTYWDSEFRYLLNVPADHKHSNGQFYLEIWRERQD